MDSPPPQVEILREYDENQGPHRALPVDHEDHNSNQFAAPHHHVHVQQDEKTPSLEDIAHADFTSIT